MKRCFKFLSCVLATVLSVGVLFSMTACEKIKTVEVKISVYDAENSTQVEKTLSVDLYKNLAPDTVDSIISYVESGYYNDSLFYKDTDRTDILFGDFKMEENEIKENSADYIKTVYGEFDANGTKMKNGEFNNVEGSVGLWRTWPANGNYNKNSDEGFNSGSATWFIPTEEKTAYNGYFCVFGKIDLSDANSDNTKAFSLLKAVMTNTEYLTSYVIFYTGETKVVDGKTDYSGLTYHRELLTDFNDKYIAEEKTYDGEKIFEAKGDELVSYNKHTVNLPVVVSGDTTTVYAKIVSASVK